jgi:predicted ATPase
MTFEISAKDFRGFHDQDFVPIRPITLLIGENSAGKTSFLAALKYMQDFLNSRPQPSFNEDPFQLGTYDQIAHFRGGKGGRAKEFSLLARHHINLRRMNPDDLSGRFTVEISLTFQNTDSHASVTRAQIKHGQTALELRYEDEELKLDWTENGERHPIPTDSIKPPRMNPRSFGSYVSFIFRDLSFRLNHTANNQLDLFREKSPDIRLLSQLAERIFRISGSATEATSAIRTRPQRTYTPGTEQQDGEGSHVPFEIAKRYRARIRDEKEWLSLKGIIDNFGVSSGMFKEIHVKAFANTASDPFQIQLSLGGPRMNLVDLGYGTSQVLPILYSVATARKGAFYLVQQPEVHLHPQAQAALGTFFVDSMLSRSINYVIETHSDFIVDRVRNAVSKGQIKREDVSLLFFTRGRLENKICHIEIGENGEPLDPPDSYRDFFIGEQMKILGL